MLIIAPLVPILCILATSFASQHLLFTYNGFQSANLSLNGTAESTQSGLLKLTNGNKHQIGHAFYPEPITFKNSPNGSTLSFSTTFVFAIVPVYPNISGHGIAFVISPTTAFNGSLPSQYLGLFDETNNGNDNNRVLAVELDTIQNNEFGDINDNHVGIDINGVKSNLSNPVGYYDNKSGGFHNLSLVSGYPMQVWVEYNGVNKQIDITLAPINVGKPRRPLLSLRSNLLQILNQKMYVGFSSSTGSFLTSHYVMGWSFTTPSMGITSTASLDLSQLPKLPRIGQREKFTFSKIRLPLLSVVLVLTVGLAIGYYVKRKRKFAEVLEDWEREYGPHRYKFKDLYIATKGFRDTELLGSGGFGRVYKGSLPNSKMEIAVKRVSHESRQGMREFVAEIISMGQLRHRNLVPLMGYCRRKGELLLVYEYMSNGSLDKFLFGQTNRTLNWGQRFCVIKGVASGLFYLHEEWEKVVVHRDVKASNVLLDGELNGRLGDFGLARLYDRGTDPQTTHVVGTLGYLAPEHTRTGKATTSTDVYAFGAFLLEVACGRRPIEPRGSVDDKILVDWVFECWNRGNILEAVDVNLGAKFVAEEVELVLKLGLLCSHSEPEARPSMRQIIEHLEGRVPLRELSSSSSSSSLGICATGLTFAHRKDFHDFSVSSYPYSSSGIELSKASTVAESILSEGR